MRWSGVVPGISWAEGEALGMSLPHSALAPSGQPIWLDLATRSARALVAREQGGMKLRDILTDKAVHNAMVVHAAFGGSTNLLLHVPAIAHASSDDAWAAFRADVRAKCLAAAPDMRSPTVVVHPLGTDTHGIAVLIAGTDKRICVYDKHSKTVELTPAT